LPGKDNYCALEAGPWGVILNGTLEENISQIRGKMMALKV
jgi:hypothetical protein